MVLLKNKIKRLNVILTARAALKKLLVSPVTMLDEPDTNDTVNILSYARDFVRAEFNINIIIYNISKINKVETK